MSKEPPKCFISYSWDSEEHRAWVHRFSGDLEAAEIDVVIDRQVKPGASLTQFMESAVRESDMVLIVCTPRYAEKANNRMGGVGYETGIVTGELFQLAPERKFIPIIRSGRSVDALPTYLSDRRGLDFRLDEKYTETLRSLVHDLHGEPDLSPEAAHLVAREQPPDPSNEATGEKAHPEIPSLRTSELREILRNDGRPVVVEFWAPWCGPCRVLHPVVNEIAAEHAGSTRFTRVNVDEEQEFAAEHEVLSIPTMIVFKHQKPAKKVVGAMPKGRLLREIEDFLGDEDPVQAADEMVALTWHEGRIQAALLRRDGTYSYVSADASRLGLVYLPKFVRTEFAKAVAELEELLNDSYVKKEDIRAFLEKHPDVLLGGEYKAAHPQILLRRDGVQSLRPDFMLEPMAGELADVVEIEPAEKRAVTTVDGVAELSEVVVQACARLREYRDYFEEERHRIKVEDTHGIRAFRPRMFVLIGRAGDTDPVTRRRLETQLADVKLRSWDDVLAVARSRLD